MTEYFVYAGAQIYAGKCLDRASFIAGTCGFDWRNKAYALPLIDTDQIQLFGKE